MRTNALWLLTVALTTLGLASIASDFDDTDERTIRLFEESDLDPGRR